MVTNIQIRGKLKFYSKPLGRQWKWRYQVHGKMYEPKLRIPQALQGVKIIDPLHPETMPAPEKPPKWIPPRRHPLLESFFPQLTIRDHSNYNETPIKRFDRTVKFHAGIEQACLLTKSVAFNHSRIDLKTADELSDNKQDELIKTYIRQALAFDPTKEPSKSYNPPTDEKFHIAKEYATPFKRQMKIIVDNLLRLANIKVFRKYPDQILDRFVYENCPQLTILTRGDDTIQIRNNSDLIITSNSKLSQLASSSEIDKTVEHNFIDMYPIFPTIDLKDENIYDLQKPFVSGVLNKSNIHTLVHLNDDNFSNEEDICRLMMFTFGSAYGQYLIQKSETDSDGRLKSPIVVNGVSITNQRFNFLTYQLNTVNLSTSQGVKNMCFYDIQDNEIYSNRPTKEKLPFLSYKNLQRLALNHLEYNPIVFKKFLAMIAFNAAAK